MSDYTTLSAVEQIAALEPPVLRNLQITQSYYELSTLIARRTGPGANWCTFATWASKQAGQTIRGDDLPRLIEDFLHGKPETEQAASAVHTASRGAAAPPGEPTSARRQLWELFDPRAILVHAADAVARGNQKVYAEIGRAFARFSETCLNAPACDAAGIAAFTNTLRPGAPPEGQENLRRAFAHLYSALFEPDAKTRAEYLLLSNLEIGFHEQTRLQPEIAEALEASIPAPAVFARRVLDAFFPRRGWLIALGWQLLRLFGRRTALDAAIESFHTQACRHVRRLLTDHMMKLHLPHTCLNLDEDMPADFPENLRQLQNPELKALLAGVDFTPDSTARSGAVDWADLRERMHFIADLFRCYHDDDRLLQPPFTAEQTAAIRAGHVPSGERL